MTIFFSFCVIIKTIDRSETNAWLICYYFLCVCIDKRGLIKSQISDKQRHNDQVNRQLRRRKRNETKFAVEKYSCNNNNNNNNNNIMRLFGVRK